jgi:hypothetical protein
LTTPLDQQPRGASLVSGMRKKVALLVCFEFALDNIVQSKAALSPASFTHRAHNIARSKPRLVHTVVS